MRMGTYATISRVERKLIVTKVHHNMKFKDLAALIALGALWGGSFLLIRIAVPAFGPFALIGARIAIAGVLLYVGLALIGRAPSGLAGNARQLLVLGAVNAAIPFTLIAWAELRLSASLAAILNATTPLFGAFLSIVWLGERITPKRGSGMLIGVLGVATLVGWSPVAMTGAMTLSIAAMLLASASYAFAGVHTKRNLSHLPSSTLAFGQQAAAFVWMIVPALLNPPRLPVPRGAIWSLLGLAVLCTSVAYLLFFRLIARIGPTRTYTVTYIIPVFGMLWGYLFLGERVALSMFVGLAMILSSMLLVNDVGMPRIVRFGRASRAPSGDAPC